MNSHNDKINHISNNGVACDVLVDIRGYYVHALLVYCVQVDNCVAYGDNFDRNNNHRSHCIAIN